MSDTNYLDINREGWNKRTALHLDSDFYDHANFLKGVSSLKEIEMSLLGNLDGKEVLHLQCHFGQDSISLAKMGAKVTAVDLSPIAIQTAKKTAQELDIEVEFICNDVLAPDLLIDRQFDLVFISYGAIPWLPKLDSWAELINTRLKDSGRLVFVEFHPVIHMLDDEAEKIQYSYFNAGPITGEQDGSYAEKDSNQIGYVVWNHSIGEVVSALLDQGLQIDHFKEYPFSPYPCFPGMVSKEEGRHIIERFGDMIPLCYSLIAKK